MNFVLILILFIFFVLSSYLLGIKSNPIEFTKNPEEGDFFEGDILGIVSTILKYRKNIKTQ